MIHIEDEKVKITGGFKEVSNDFFRLLVTIKNYPELQDVIVLAMKIFESKSYEVKISDMNSPIKETLS